mgnify:CR=1 FL=1
MSDERFEDFLKREAQAYNTPPAEVPREELWETIRASRAAERDATVRPLGGARVIGTLPAQSDTPKLRYTSLIGLAATLLLGIGIGRYALQRDAAVTELASQIATAMTGESDGLATPSAASTQGAASSAEAPDGALVTLAVAPADPVRPRMDVPSARIVTRVAGRINSGTGTAGDAGLSGEPNAAMQIVSRDHLSRAEALVSVVAASPSDAAMDSLTGRWARDMLTNTRLLLDSPAGDDAVRRRLLEDLETVLVQLLQRTGGAVDERALIDRTLQRTQLLSRLRTGAAGI